MAIRVDLWTASPSKLTYLGADVKDYDICCKACGAMTPEGEYRRYCHYCKYKDDPITVEEILKTRRKY